MKTNLAAFLALSIFGASYSGTAVGQENSQPTSPPGGSQTLGEVKGGDEGGSGSNNADDPAIENTDLDKHYLGYDAIDIGGSAWLGRPLPAEADAFTGDLRLRMGLTYVTEHGEVGLSIPINPIDRITIGSDGIGFSKTLSLGNFQFGSVGVKASRGSDLKADMDRLERQALETGGAALQGADQEILRMYNYHYGAAIFGF